MGPTWRLGRGSTRRDRCPGSCPEQAMSKRIFGIAVAASLALAASFSAWADFAGTVVGVTDGDTITVLDASKTRHKVRLAGIDAPERDQPGGFRAKESLSRLVYERRVRVEGDKKDPTTELSARCGSRRRIVRVAARRSTPASLRSPWVERGGSVGTRTSNRPRTGGATSMPNRKPRPGRSGCGEILARCRRGNGEMQGRLDDGALAHRDGSEPPELRSAARTVALIAARR